MRYLYDQTEPVTLEYDSVIVRHPVLADGTEAACGRMNETLSPLAPGSYLITEDLAPGKQRTRYLGVVGDSYTVMQLTVGAFTSDYFDVPAHSNRIPVNYYVNSRNLADSTFRGFEQDYGDAIYPHLMANSLGQINPEYAQANTNWDSLKTDEIIERLTAYDQYWQKCGFEPLHGLATYTPSNSLIAAMKEMGWNVLHSIIPEQNWSDGRWAINHWGMPNQAFYVADDDFRKPMRRDEKNVVAMGMNSYHLYMPHVTNWGDNVLSPSHFLRWHRTVESGQEPIRFKAFLDDYLAAVRSQKAPFFLIAGFEFGRTFGVRSMTQHNRRGMELVIEAAKTLPIVFATGRDVALYYEKFLNAHPEVVYTQRDYLAGTRIMDKPVNSGPSIGMEMKDYKAVFAHLEPLPFYHYDYLEEWQYAADDVDMPRDYAADDRDQVRIDKTCTSFTISVESPLFRAIPVAIWDAKLTEEVPFRKFLPAVLDDERVHTVLELPVGWSGVLELSIATCSKPPAAEFSGSEHPAWRVQKIGDCCYLYIDFPVTRPFELEWQVPAECRLDAPDKVVGNFTAGQMVTLSFDARRLWYRIHGLNPEQIIPDQVAMTVLDAESAESQRFFDQVREELPLRQQELDEWFATQIPENEYVEYEIDCFGNNIFGERSRAKKFDRVVRCGSARLRAEELSDGGISLGHGRSFWVHPRGLHFELAGVDKLESRDGLFSLTLFTRTPNIEPNLFSYNIQVKNDSGEEIFKSSKSWVCPHEASPESIFRIILPIAAFTNGVVDVIISAAQQPVLDDWYRDGGFIAALERLSVSLRKN